MFVESTLYYVGLNDYTASFVVSPEYAGMHCCRRIDHCKIQGPVVQSVVSLTSSLRVISLTVLADSIYNILIFFAEKM